MKTISFILLIISLLRCQKEKISDNFLVNSTIEKYKTDLPKKIIFYRDKTNSDVKDTKKYIFLDANNLLKKNDENFYELGINNKNNKIFISIFSHKTNQELTCIFNNNGKLISKEVSDLLPMETKPYYIYYEILKRKYPDYMNWKLFPIPKDSLK